MKFPFVSRDRLEEVKSLYEKQISDLKQTITLLTGGPIPIQENTPEEKPAPSLPWTQTLDPRPSVRAKQITKLLERNFSSGQFNTLIDAIDQATLDGQARAMFQNSPVAIINDKPASN